MFKIAYFEVKKMLRDYRLLLVFLLQPVILIYLLGNTVAHTPDKIDVSVFNQYQNEISMKIITEMKSSETLSVKECTNQDSAETSVYENKSKLAVTISLGGNSWDDIKIVRNSIVPDVSARAEKIVLEALTKLNSNNLSAPISVRDNTSKTVSYFDYYASAIIILLLILICLNASVTAITQERIDGTFERFFVTPYSKATMVFGKMVSYVGISLTLSLITIFSLKFFFDVNLGPIWLIGLITFVTGLAAIALGLLVSSVTYTIGESIQVGTLIFFSILILTGLIFQPESMQPFILKLHDVIPFTYSMTAMREVNILGFGFSKVVNDLFIIGGSAVLFLIVAVIFLRRKTR